MADLYYISASDPDEDYDHTLFTVANSPEQAHALWKRHWWEGEGAPFFDGPIVAGSPGRSGCLLIYEVVYDPDAIGALAWGRDLQIVAHVPLPETSDE